MSEQFSLVISSHFPYKESSCKVIHQHRSCIHPELLCLELAAVCINQLAKVGSGSSAILMFLLNVIDRNCKTNVHQCVWPLTLVCYLFDSMWLLYRYITEMAKRTWCTKMSFVLDKLFKTDSLIHHSSFALIVFMSLLGLAQLALKNYSSYWKKQDFNKTFNNYISSWN